MVATRNPDLTREKLLQAAFQEIYHSGFQAASLDSILASAGVTKGALYHHFPSKTALGYAVVDEVIRQQIVHQFLRPLEKAEDPIDALLDILQKSAARMSPELCRLGCPLNNLAQEMSPVDEGFRLRLEEILRTWRDGLAAALRRGQDSGRVRADIDPAKSAAFIVAVVEGALGMTKNGQRIELFHACCEGLEQYLHTLRAWKRRTPGKTPSRVVAARADSRD